jgi:hypothetical protein
MVNDESSLETFDKMQASVRSWGMLLIATGGSYKPDKCFHHLISFIWDRKGRWSYAQNHDNSDYEMVVPMPDGSEVKIDHLPVTQARELLGVWSSPDGNAKESLLKMKEKAQEWVDQAKEGRLRRRDVWFLLDVQFWPRVGYGICCNMAKHSKLDSVLIKQYYQMIPLGGVARTAPASVRQLHRGFYGIGCPHPGIKCLTSQVSKLLMHFGTKSSVGTKMAVSLWELILELGVLFQPFLEPYERYKKRIMWSWMAALWEKCSLYRVDIEVLDTPLSFPRERDGWLMLLFAGLGFTAIELEILHRVRIYQQVIFLSCILNAKGTDIDEKYLYRRPSGQKWSVLKFPNEQPSSSDFRFWHQALQQLVPAGGLAVRLGRSLHSGYKIWDWRVNSEEGYLLHYRDGVMNVYEQSAGSSRRWQMWKGDCEAVVLGRPCSVREVGMGILTTTAVAPPLDVPIEPQTILDVICGWNQSWFWRTFRIVGNLEWLI